MAKYYTTDTELNMALGKLLKMTNTQRQLVYDSNKDTMPPQNLLAKSQRDKNYNELSMKALEYLWFGSKKASITQRIIAKAIYNQKIDDETNPRAKMLFTLEENQMVCEQEEMNMMRNLKNVSITNETEKGW